MILKVKTGKISNIALKYIENFASLWDTTELQYIRFIDSKCKYEVVSGACYFPSKTLPKYRIQCRLSNIKYPLTISIKNTDSKDSSITLYNDDESVIWVFGHELQHYLAKTKQLAGGINEENADYFGVVLLVLFRQFLKNNFDLEKK